MLAAVFAFAILAAPSAAPTKNAALVAAEAAYRALDYDEVMNHLDRARTEPTSADEYARIVELTATMDAIYGRRERAIEGFVELLRMRPDYALPPRTSPKIGEALSAAKDQRAVELAAARDAELARSAPVVTQLPPDAAVLTVAPAPPPPRPAIYARPWFWAAIGGAAVVTATVILLTSTKAPDHDVGPFALR